MTWSGLFDQTGFEVGISADLKRQLDLYVALCPYEISGLGEVEVHGDFLVVTALHLLRQEVSPAETVLSVQDLLRFTDGAAARGIELKKVKLWWHSHATNSSYWSPTDEATIESLGKPPWLLSVVGNHSGEYLARLDTFPTEHFPLRLTAHGRLVVDYNEEEVKETEKEIREKVKKKRKKKKPKTRR